MRALAVLALAMSLSGCLDAGGVSDLLGKDTYPTESVTWYLTEDHGAAEVAPEATAVPLGWSWSEWFAGEMAPHWTVPAAASDYIITAANITITYETLVPLVDSQTRPPFTVWFGAGDSIIEHAFADGPDVWLPGDVQTITFPVDDLPLGGLVVEQGVMPVVHVGTYYPDGAGAQNVLVHLGESRLDFETQAVRLPSADRSFEIVSATDQQLTGGRCVAPLNPNDSAMATYEMDVPEEAVGLDVIVERTGGEGLGIDMDFGITDAAGETVAHAAGSASPEAIHLRAPNMAAAEPGTWTLTVYNCQPQVATYDVTATLLLD